MVFLTVTMDSISIFYQNTRGLRTKTHIFLRNVAINNYDIIVLTETWLNEDVLSTELFDSRYAVFRRDRCSTGFHSKKEGGGVLIAVSKRLSAKRMTDWESMCEDIWVVVHNPLSGAHRKLAISAIYLPPPVQSVMLEHYLDHCNSVLENHDGHTCIIGDFNLSCINWDLINTSASNYHTTALNRILIDFSYVANLKQCNQVPNSRNKVLDLVFVDLPSCTVSPSMNSLCPIDPMHPTLDIDIAFDRITYLQTNPNNHKN